MSSLCLNACKKTVNNNTADQRLDLLASASLCMCVRKYMSEGVYKRKSRKCEHWCEFISVSWVNPSPATQHNINYSFHHTVSLYMGLVETSWCESRTGFWCILFWYGILITGKKIGKYSIEMHACTCIIVHLKFWILTKAK